MKERKKQKAVDNIRLRKVSENRKNDLSKLDQTIQELEIEHQESIWEHMKDTYEPTAIVQKLLKKLSQMDEETQETFIENILFPEKLKNEFIDNEKQARATL